MLMFRGNYFRPEMINAVEVTQYTSEGGWYVNVYVGGGDYIDISGTEHLSHAEAEQLRDDFLVAMRLK